MGLDVGAYKNISKRQVSKTNVDSNESGTGDSDDEENVFRVRHDTFLYQVKDLPEG